MRLILGLCVLASAVLASVAALVVRVIEYVAYLMPEPQRPALVGFGTHTSTFVGGDQVDGATFNRLRHESAVHRRSANRNI